MYNFDIKLLPTAQNLYMDFDIADRNSVFLTQGAT